MESFNLRKLEKKLLDEVETQCAEMFTMVFMDNLIANIGAERAEFIARGLAPNNDYEKGIFWTVKIVKSTLKDFKKDNDNAE